MAPPADRVPQLVEDLLLWLEETELHPLASSGLVHYELEFIHPFADGNDRMGRLWQSLILMRWRQGWWSAPSRTSPEAASRDIV